jgi:hypothetical protein
MKFALGLSAAVLFLVTSAQADTFGTGPNTFAIDFVNIGNAGNANDAGAGGGLYSTPYGGVAYEYRMGTYEISQDAITMATAGGLLDVTAGAWAGSQPAAFMTRTEAAMFVNWLNTSTGHPAAYNIAYGYYGWFVSLWSSGEAWQFGGENLYRHKDAYYFLPSEDEWYKAAYHQNDGVTANYWDYPTGSNSVPDVIDWAGDPSYQVVFSGGLSYNPGQPNAVTNAGSSASAYGTYAQGGNVEEWMEGARDDDPLDPIWGYDQHRGGFWTNFVSGSNSTTVLNSGTTSGATLGSGNVIGFRVASVPEPSSAVLVLGSGLVLLFRRGSRARG